MFLIHTKKRLKSAVVHVQLSDDLTICSWIYGLHHQVKVSRGYFSKRIRYFDDVDPSNNSEPIGDELIFIMSYLTSDIIGHLPINREEESSESFDSYDAKVLEYIYEHILYCDEDKLSSKNHMFPYINPKMGVQFVLNYLLSRGRFET